MEDNRGRVGWLLNEVLTPFEREHLHRWCEAKDVYSDGFGIWGAIVQYLLTLDESEIRKEVEDREGWPAVYYRATERR